MTRTEHSRMESLLSRMNRREKQRLYRRLARMFRPVARSGRGATGRLVALRELCARMAALPVRNPCDGLSNRDHDRILYYGGRA